MYSPIDNTIKSPKLQLLVGPIASGKTTYCKKVCESNDYVVVNDDSIMTMIHGGLYRYDESLKSLYKGIETYIIHHGISLGRTVVIDRPNHKRATRIRYIELAHSLDVPVEILMFKRLSPTTHARRRSIHGNNRGISSESWLAIAKKHDSDWEEPDKSIEKFEHIRKIDYYMI